MSEPKAKAKSSVIVISPAWPSTDSGRGLAVSSLLRQCSQVFPRVCFIGLVDHLFDQHSSWNRPGIEFKYIPIRRLSHALRFALSLASPLPAISHQFVGRRVKEQVIKTLVEELRQQLNAVLICEDLPLSVALLSSSRRQFPDLPVAVRSEYVASKMFLPLRNQGSFFYRVSWQIEVAKIQKQEVAVCRSADRVWAISQNDLDEYRHSFNILCNGVIGVGIDIDRYSSITGGDPFTLVSIGSFDLRKSLGLRKFIEGPWHEILRQYPMANLLLGGINSEQFTNPELNIVGAGWVKDDREILSQGLIALNTQEIGAGINLKSIVAMSAGRALVSTQKGVEGIAGKLGEHFLIGPSVESLAPLLMKLLGNVSLAQQMGGAARKLASSVFSETKVDEQARSLLTELALISRL